MATYGQSLCETRPASERHLGFVGTHVGHRNSRHLRSRQGHHGGNPWWPHHQESWMSPVSVITMFLYRCIMVYSNKLSAHWLCGHMGDCHVLGMWDKKRCHRRRSLFSGFSGVYGDTIRLRRRRPRQHQHVHVPSEFSQSKFKPRILEMTGAFCQTCLTSPAWSDGGVAGAVRRRKTCHGEGPDRTQRAQAAQAYLAVGAHVKCAGHCHARKLTSTSFSSSTWASSFSRSKSSSSPSHPHPHHHHHHHHAAICINTSDHQCSSYIPSESGVDGSPFHGLKHLRHGPIPRRPWWPWAAFLVRI